jgi:hypothetical protein
MFCPTCRAAVDDDDVFCPKCGAGVTLKTRNQQAAGASALSLTLSPEHQAGSRAQRSRAPVMEGGTKYPGLSRVAAVSIRGGAMFRIVSYILSALAAASYIMWFYPQAPGPLPVMVGALIGVVILAFGQIVSLTMAVQGELIHLVIDIEEDLRRRT